MEASRRLKRLRAQRKRAGLDQSEVAMRMSALSGWHMTQPGFSLIESGAFPAPAGFLRYYREALKGDR